MKDLWSAGAELQVPLQSGSASHFQICRWTIEEKHLVYSGPSGCSGRTLPGPGVMMMMMMVGVVLICLQQTSGGLQKCLQLQTVLVPPEEPVCQSPTAPPLQDQCRTLSEAPPTSMATTSVSKGIQTLTITPAAVGQYPPPPATMKPNGRATNGCW